MLTTVAIPYQMYQLTGSTLAVGLLGIAALVPLLTISFLGGAIADAVDRRMLLILSDLGLAAVSGVLVFNAALADPRVWALYAVEALGTALYAIQRPAMDALVPRLVGEDQIAPAAAVQGDLLVFRARRRACDRRDPDRLRRPDRHVRDRRRHLLGLARRRCAPAEDAAARRRSPARGCERLPRASGSSATSPS